MKKNNNRIRSIRFFFALLVRTGQHKHKNGSFNYIVIYFEKLIIYLKVLSITRFENAKIKFSD